jgi:prophage antirepressor-like protein
MSENTGALKNQAIDFVKNLFLFAGKNFGYIRCGDEIYFRGKDVAEYLGYADTKQALKINVADNHKKTLGELMDMIKFEENKLSQSKNSEDFRGSKTLPLKNFKGVAKPPLENIENLKGGFATPLKKYYDSTDSETKKEIKTMDVVLLKKGKQRFPSLKKNEKNTIYISEPGLYMFATSSQKEGARAFRDYIFGVIIPTIGRTGKFSLFNENQDQKQNLQLIENPKLILDTSYVKSFYNDNTISKFYEKSTVYLGAIGMYDNKLLLKWGESDNIFRRDFYEHRNTFGPQFKIFYIVQTDNSRIVEMLFEREIKIRELNIDLQFNGKMQKEIFVTSDNFSIENAIEIIDKLVLENPTHSMSKVNTKIKEMELEIELKKLELEMIRESNKKDIREQPQILSNPNQKILKIELINVKNGIDPENANQDELDEIPEEDKYYFDTFEACTEGCKKELYYFAKNAKENETDEGAIIGKTVMSMNKLYKMLQENMERYNDLYKEMTYERTEKEKYINLYNNKNKR